jgi:hypothetical protein
VGGKGVGDGVGDDVGVAVEVIVAVGAGVAVDTACAVNLGGVDVGATVGDLALGNEHANRLIKVSRMINLCRVRLFIGLPPQVQAKSRCLNLL